MIGHLGLKCPFQNGLGQLLEQTVFPDDILGLLVVTEQLIDHLLVDCHGSFHFLPPIAVYTVLFTPSAVCLSNFMPERGLFALHVATLPGWLELAPTGHHLYDTGLQ